MPIYFDDRDRLRFLSIFGTTVERYAWRCHSYCLMPNHYHVVIETTEPNLARGMQYLNWRYALAFNNRRGFVGHLFDARYHSVIVESDLHLLELARYVVLNPVRSRLCRHPLEWRWSSYSAAIGESPAPEFLTLDWLMGQFGRDATRARARFADFVADGVESGHVFVPGTETWPVQPTPYVPGKRSARSRTRSAAGRPTTFK